MPIRRVLRAGAAFATNLLGVVAAFVILSLFVLFYAWPFFLVAGVAQTLLWVGAIDTLTAAVAILCSLPATAVWFDRTTDVGDVLFGRRRYLSRGREEYIDD